MIDKNKVIKDFWGDNLHKFSLYDLKNFGLNLDTKNYLVKCGVPVLKCCDYSEYCEYYKFIDQYTYLEKLRYQKVDGSPAYRLSGRKKFAIFAEDILEFHYLGIDLSDFTVYRIVPEIGYYCYYNKDIQTYFYCLASMISCMKKYPLLDCSYDSEEADKQSFYFAQEVYEIINSVDSRAVKCGSYWVITLTEYADAELSNHFDEYTALWNTGNYKDENEPVMEFISGKRKFSDK